MKRLHYAWEEPHTPEIPEAVRHGLGVLAGILFMALVLTMPAWMIVLGLA